jgi:hypothetical protein
MVFEQTTHLPVPFGDPTEYGQQSTIEIPPAPTTRRGYALGP